MLSTIALWLQAVNADDGTLLDDYTLTKPSNWAANSTRQTATQTNFVGNFTATWYEIYGKCAQSLKPDAKLAHGMYSLVPD